jgi:hypothetical protein
MRTSLATALLAVVVIGAPTRGEAQDFDDFAAYLALSFTPVGGLVPLPPPGGGARGSAFVFRYGNIDLGGEGGNSINNLAIGGDFAAGRGRLGLTLGATTCDGCDGNFTLGMDYTAPITHDVVSVALRPAVGFWKPTDGDGSALSFGLSLPVGVELSGATGPIFVPYLSPAIGFGRVSDEEDSESGTRPMLGGGFAITGRQSTFALHVGFQKVFVDDGEMLFGVGFSIGRRAPAP